MTHALAPFIAASVLAAGALPAHAADYPTKAIRIVVPYASGGSTDALARMVGEQLGKRLGQAAIVENKPGASEQIAITSVTKATPDGYTILLSTLSGLAVNPGLYGTKLPYDPLKDLAPVLLAATVPSVVVVHPSVPAKTMAELGSYLKANQGKVSYASAGNGTSAHLAAELFKAMTGAPMLHVPYRGSGPALIDMITGQVHVMFDTLTSSVQHIRDGKLRALAVTTATPSPALPGTPTVAETVPGFEVTAWFGVGVPKGTPPAVIEKLNREINAALNDPKIRARLAELGAVPFVATPAQMVAHVAAETEKWGKAVQFSGARVD